MHLMKIKGNGKIPDYIQFRDDKFALLAYFNVNSYIKSLLKEKLELYSDDVLAIIEGDKYGELIYIENK